MDFLALDASDQLRALASRRISAVEALDLAIARAERLQTEVNAISGRRVEAARLEAHHIDQARSRGDPLGCLAGLPITVKDTLDVEGMPASAGRADLLQRDARDAVSVGLLRAQGAVVWAHTNVPVNAGDWQTYNPVYGTTRNPWKLDRTPGGSSGGSAAALAAGITSLEVGADIAGSLRIPASFCGVFAHKPTFGTISQKGLVPPYEGELDMAVVGPLARSGRDLKMLFRVLAGEAVAASAAPRPEALRVGLWIDERSYALDASVLDLVETFAAKLAAAGLQVRSTHGPVPGAEVLETYTSLMYPLLWEDAPPAELALYRILRGPARLARRLGAGPLSWAQGVLGATSGPEARWAAQEARIRRASDVSSFFERFDVIVAPCAPTAAFPHTQRGIPAARRLRLSDGRSVGYLQLMTWGALASVWGLPATAVPIGFTPEGLPVGAQLIGPQGADLQLLELAEFITDRLGGFVAPTLTTVEGNDMAAQPVATSPVEHSGSRP